MSFSSNLKTLCDINDWGFINHLNRRFEVSVIINDWDDEFIITELINKTATDCNVDVLIVIQQYVDNLYTAFVDVQ